MGEIVNKTNNIVDKTEEKVNETSYKTLQIDQTSYDTLNYNYLELLKFYRTIGEISANNTLTQMIYFFTDWLEFVNNAIDRPLLVQNSMLKTYNEKCDYLMKASKTYPTLFQIATSFQTFLTTALQRTKTQQITQ